MKETRCLQTRNDVKINAHEQEVRYNFYTSGRFQDEKAKKAKEILHRKPYYMEGSCRKENK